MDVGGGEESVSVSRNTGTRARRDRISRVCLRAGYSHGARVETQTGPSEPRSEGRLDHRPTALAVYDALRRSGRALAATRASREVHSPRTVLWLRGAARGGVQGPGRQHRAVIR